MSPLTLESSAGAPAATLQSVLVGGLFNECAVTRRRVAGHDTDLQRAVQPGLPLSSQNHKSDFKSFAKHLKFDTIMITCQKSKNIFPYITRIAVCSSQEHVLKCFEILVAYLMLAQ